MLVQPNSTRPATDSMHASDRQPLRQISPGRAPITFRPLAATIPHEAGSGRSLDTFHRQIIQFVLAWAPYGGPPMKTRSSSSGCGPMCCIGDSSLSSAVCFPVSATSTMPTADCWLARWSCCIRRSGPSHAARLTAIDRLTAMICSHTGALADAEPVASATRLTARRCGGGVDPHGHRCAPALDRSACRGHITAPHAYRVSRRTNRTGVGLCLFPYRGEPSDRSRVPFVNWHAAQDPGNGLSDLMHDCTMSHGIQTVRREVCSGGGRGRYPFCPHVDM